MSDESKPTPGPWEAGTRYRGSYVVWGPDRANEDYFVSIHEGPDAGKNARLTAEAGTVYHETGLTPRQLVEQLNAMVDQRDELLAIVQRFIALPSGAWHPIRHAAEEAELAEDARAAIAKAKGEA